MYIKRQTEKKTQNLNILTYIYVVGTNKLQNDLLLSFLREKTGFDGKCIKNLGNLTPMQKKEQNLPQFVILDWTDVNNEKIWNNIYSWRNSNSYRCFFAFYNVDSTMKIEKMALTNNIQGLFYKEDPLDVINKGVSAILKGDLWYSRTSLKKYIMESNSFSVISEHVGASNLTFRERDVLALIAAGSSNKTISDRLCISIHTVKNHICNIYRKINVSNRLQAAFWAAKYL
jgi:DNA-binding NarL/FixJ family response regulator